MNELMEAIERFDHEIIRRWNACKSVNIIADELGVCDEYVEIVISEPENYKECHV